MDDETPTPNISLLRKVVELAEAEVAANGAGNDAHAAGKWDQREWVEFLEGSFLETEEFHGMQVLTQKATCNTTGCIAGHTVMLAGDRII